MTTGNPNEGRMPKKPRSRRPWDDPEFDADDGLEEPMRPPAGGSDDLDEYHDWREDRGRRGRKRRDKAGGRHEKNRQRDHDEPFGDS